MRSALHVLEYYESEGFRNMYVEALYESYRYEHSDVVDRIRSVFYRERDMTITKAQAEMVYAYILDNFEESIDEFVNYYTGGRDICSISFGEQEEQIELSEVEEYEEAGFSVRRYDDYALAYYNLTDQGVYVNPLLVVGDIDGFVEVN